MPQRIGIISHDFYPYQGGLGRHATTLLTNLNTHLTDFEFIGISPNQNNLNNHNTKLGFTKALPADQLQFSLFFQLEQEKIIKEESLDALILNGGPGGVFCLRKPSVPLVYIANHTYYQQSDIIPGQSWKKMFIPFEKKGYQHAAEIVAISSTTKKTLISKYGLSPQRISVIPPGFEFSNSPDFERSGNDFLFLGRIDERKGLRFLLESMAAFPGYFSEGTLHVVGSGKDFQRLKNYAHTQLADKVLFHGFIPDEKLADITSLCRAQIIPSRLEGFGMTAVESIQTGLPLIVSAVDGLTDIVKDKETGLLVPYGDSLALAKACQFAIANRKEMQKYARNAFQNAKEEFSWKVVSDKYSRLIRSLFTH